MPSAPPDSCSFGKQRCDEGTEFPISWSPSRLLRYVPKRSAARARAFAASSSLFFAGAVVSSECSRRLAIAAISSTAASKVASFALEGLVNPLIFRTNWSEAARTSSSVTGGSKLNSVLIFLHISDFPTCDASRPSRAALQAKPGAQHERPLAAEHEMRHRPLALTFPTTP